MKLENKNFEIEFIDRDCTIYDQKFIRNLYNKINQEKKKLLNILQIKDCRKVKIKLYKEKERFINDIKKFYEEYDIPVYCRGTIQEGIIYFLVNTELKENTYIYELELRKVVHEYIHILYEEYILCGKKRITWVDEGIALNLSRERGKFIKERFPILEKGLNKINLNELSHENQTFMNEKVNGYDISYLTIKYLIETLTKEEFNKLIRNNEELEKIRKWNMEKSKRIF
mgnify:CR=1 FL=1